MSCAVLSRIGKVTGYLRDCVWYLCYFEHCQRKRLRVGPDRYAVWQLAPGSTTNSNAAHRSPPALSREA